MKGYAINFKIKYAVKMLLFTEKYDTSRVNNSVRHLVVSNLNYGRFLLSDWSNYGS